jgi:hypothetical protein
VTASFTVANTGGCAAAEVVPVYVHQPVSDVVAPTSGWSASPG